MEKTDDKLNIDGEATAADTGSKDDAAIVPPAEVKSAPAPDGEPAAKPGFTQELIGISVKAVAVALSLVMLILSILTVVMPLQAMRVFNKLGFTERALNSGDRYISRRLREYDADTVDERGDFNVISNTEPLADADMKEALEVCIGLSDTLMKDNVNTDKKSTVYFAEKLDRYIRQYMSLADAYDMFDAKNKANIAAMAPAIKPFVYDYKHTLMVMDYTARVYLGETDSMLRDVGRTGEIMTSVVERAQTYGGLVISGGISRDLTVSLLDGFCNYIDQLGAYLTIQQAKLGVTKLIGEDNKDIYKNVLSGSEFELFISPEKGRTLVFNNLTSARYAEWAKLAVDFTPSGINELDERMHQLYWLRIMTNFADRMLNMGRLMYYSSSRYGQYAQDIIDLYGDSAFDNYRYVQYTRAPATDPRGWQIGDIYNDLMSEYLTFFS